jgi:hypothetical protein
MLWSGDARFKGFERKEYGVAEKLGFDIDLIIDLDHHHLDLDLEHHHHGVTTHPLSSSSLMRGRTT